MTVNEMRNNPPEGCRVYRYTFPNGMIYIGQTKRYLYLRYLDKYKNKRLMDAFAKYGWENTKKEILIDGLTREQAMEEEIKLIGLCDACNPNIGYNISRGGNLGFSGLKHTEETKKKMSISGKGKHSGTNNWNAGKTRTEEQKEKNRQSHKHIMKAVYQIDNNDKIIGLFESVSAASRAVNTTVRNIRLCLTGKSKTAKGYKWRYVEN